MFLSLNGETPHISSSLGVDYDGLTMTGSNASASYGYGEIIIDTDAVNDVWILG